MGNREVTIHRKWRHLVHKTHDEEIQTKKQTKNTTQNTHQYQYHSIVDSEKIQDIQRLIEYQSHYYLPIESHLDNFQSRIVSLWLNLKKIYIYIYLLIGV
jgi:hypothetical protein